MSNSQRLKGKAGELELARLLSEKLGLAINRNLSQARQGGVDLILPGWALEVKRAKRLEMTAWWTQTLLQAAGTTNAPALAYRLDRSAWRFVVALRHLSEAFSGQSLWMTAELDIDGFCLVVRESLKTPRSDTDDHDFLAFVDASEHGVVMAPAQEGPKNRSIGAFDAKPTEDHCLDGKTPEIAKKRPSRYPSESYRTDIKVIL